MSGWFTPKSFTRIGATGEQLLEAFKAAFRAGCAKFLEKTDTPSGQLAAADEKQEGGEQIA